METATEARHRPALAGRAGARLASKHRQALEWQQEEFSKRVLLNAEALSWIPVPPIFGIPDPVIEPEKSPAEKALDQIAEAERDFIAKRKAKRETHQHIEATKSAGETLGEFERAKALDRACHQSKLPRLLYTQFAECGYRGRHV